MRIFFIALCLFVSVSAPVSSLFAHSVSARSVAYSSPRQDPPNWSTWEAVQGGQRIKQRKTLIYVATDWCNWCRKMDIETFGNPSVSRFMNERFNLVRFNAEQKEEITYQGKKYGYTKAGQRGYNEWVAVLLNGRISFPSIIFLDEEANVIQPISGFKTSEELLLIMQYIQSNAYKHTPWTTYQKGAKPN